MAFPVTAPGTTRPPTSARAPETARARESREAGETETETARATWSGHSGGAFELPARPCSVREARVRVRQTLTRWDVPAEAVADAVLVVSELVTNAIVHTGTETVVCALRHDAGWVRVEVSGRRSGPTIPQPHAACPEDENGRGLALIQALCTAWGVFDAADGRSRAVWAALATGPRS